MTETNMQRTEILVGDRVRALVNFRQEGCFGDRTGIVVEILSRGRLRVLVESETANEWITKARQGYPGETAIVYRKYVTKHEAVADCAWRWGPR